jgi:hypothetical protein
MRGNSSEFLSYFIVSDLIPCSYRPLAVVASHLALSVWLSAAVGRSLYRSRYELRPAQDTRQRSASRSRNLPIFAGLAVLSLASAAYGALQYAALSYRVWASERDVPVPARYYGTAASHDDPAEFHIARWLDDTPLYLDAAEILAEKARRFWWAQQIDLSLVSWTMLLSIEGRRRNIPLLWCYQVLAQLVSLPYAQNLFFLALIFNPSPLPQDESGSSRYALVVICVRVVLKRFVALPVFGTEYHHPSHRNGCHISLFTCWSSSST